MLFLKIERIIIADAHTRGNTFQHEGFAGINYWLSYPLLLLLLKIVYYPRVPGGYPGYD